MSHSHYNSAPGHDERAHPAPEPAAPATTSPDTPRLQRRETRRWWIKLVLQPLLFLACGALLLFGLGLAQRMGLLEGGGAGGGTSGAGIPGVRYICPMMCTPPQEEPGRCPVCGMELVPATSGSGPHDALSVTIAPAARRVANIETVPVSSMPLKRTLRVIGELRYDEGTLRTISAYVDGRLDRLYADYTGVVVQKGDHLALFYSPLLYSAQVELLLAKKSVDQARPVASQTDLYASARERLSLLGMTDSQIEQLIASGQANSRMHLSAPISGTVIEKLAVEGQYVKEGDAIYRLADLSTVWLILRLFPEDAAVIRYGQKVEAEVHSLPGLPFEGRVAFVDPNVDPQTRTVGVRVVIPNEDGLLRVGDYARAEIQVPMAGTKPGPVYDAELANKWISPRHPHVVADAPGDCPICGIDLVPARQFGFTDQPHEGAEVLVLPRDAVLMAGDHSVLYVETHPGRFELRQVVLGAITGNMVEIRSGVGLGERVATRGNFLIDSQMQLAGNPSLIDPMKFESPKDDSLPPEALATLSKLPEEDRALATRQRICPVADFPLGMMGTPSKVDVQGTPVFICCEGCRAKLLADPAKYLAKLPPPPAAEKEDSKQPSPKAADPEPSVPPPDAAAPPSADGPSPAEARR